MRPEVTPVCPDCGEDLYRAMWENEHGLVSSEVRCRGCDTPRTACFPTVFVNGPDDAPTDSRYGGTTYARPASADD